MLYKLVSAVFSVYTFLVLLNVIFSWIRVGDNAFTRFVWELTEPPLDLIRHYIPIVGGLDFSPVVLFIALGVLERMCYRILFMFF